MNSYLFSGRPESDRPEIWLGIGWRPGWSRGGDRRARSELEAPALQGDNRSSGPEGTCASFFFLGPQDAMIACVLAFQVVEGIYGLAFKILNC